MTELITNLPLNIFRESFKICAAALAYIFLAMLIIKLWYLDWTKTD